MAMLTTTRGIQNAAKTLLKSCPLKKQSSIGIVKGARRLQRSTVSNLHTCIQWNQGANAAVITNKPWQLASAVCLERFPVVCQEMTEPEQRYFDMISNIELERSSLSPHEVSVAADRRRMARKQSGEQDEEGDEEGDGGDLLTALDLEDLATEELTRFKTAPRITEADEKNNRHSLDRKLSDKLVLLVKCKVGDKSVWLLPYGLRDEGETMKDAAQRVLLDHMGDSGRLRTLFMGNAPVGFYKQRYPKALQEETGNAGVKVFFFKAQYMSGLFQKREDSQLVEDYHWVSPDELSQYLEESYLDTVQKFILPV